MFPQVARTAYDVFLGSRHIKQGFIAKQRKVEPSISSMSLDKPIQGYLDLAKVYIEKKDFHAAIEAYDNGIHYILSSLDAHYYYAKEQHPDHDIDRSTVQQQKSNTISLRQGLPKTWNNGINITNTKHQEDLMVLKKERRTVLAALVQHSHRFHQCIPYEILYKIFEYMDNFKDLLECTKVCKHWCKSMLTFSFFWNNMSPTNNNITSDIFWPSVEIMIQHKSRSHKVYVKSDSLPYRSRYNKYIKMSVKDIFSILLSVSDNHNIEKLCFYNIEFRDENIAGLLGNVLENMKSPPLNHVQFNHCRIPAEHKGIAPILLSCSNFTHVTFNNSYTPHLFDDLSDALLPAFSALTYLKLTFGLIRRSQANTINIMSLFEENMFFSHCPNLLHLFIIFDNISFNLGSCAEAALKHCPRLKNVILGNGRETMPKVTFLCNIVESEFDNNYNGQKQLKNNSNNTHPYDQLVKEFPSNTSAPFEQSFPQLPQPTTTKGCMRRFIILNSCRKYQNEDDLLKNQAINSVLDQSTIWERCFSIVNKFNQDSLELLYIKWNFIAIQGLNTWCKNYTTASNLRELRLHDDADYCTNIPKKYIEPVDKNNILVKLFTHLPSLETLSIHQSGPSVSYNEKKQHSPFYFYQPGHHLFVDDSVLKQLVKHCRRIRYIQIKGFSIYTYKGVLSLTEENIDSITTETFSLSTQLPIVYLEMEIPHGIILSLVKKMPSLKELKVRTINWKYCSIQKVNSILPSIRQEVESILSKRGGSLAFHI